MTYHIRANFNGIQRVIEASYFRNAQWLANVLLVSGTAYQIWAENENACWVIASSQSRENWQQWNHTTD